MYVMLQVPSSGLSGWVRYPGTYLPRLLGARVRRPGIQGLGRKPQIDSPQPIEPRFAEPTTSNDYRAAVIPPKMADTIFLVDLRRLCPPVTYFYMC